jgi:hypothetical protein
VGLGDHSALKDNNRSDRHITVVGSDKRLVDRQFHKPLVYIIIVHLAVSAINTKLQLQAVIIDKSVP